MRMAEEYPLTGVGPNNFIYVNSQIYQSGTTLMQHNVFVQAVSELGYPGLLLFIGMIIYCFRNQRRARKLLREKGIDDPFLYGLSHGLDICLVGFAVNGFFITVLYYPFFWMLLILSTSLFDVVKHLEQQSEQPVPVAGISERPWLQTVEASRYVKS
jgi:O-antigen ligase